MDEILHFIECNCPDTEETKIAGSCASPLCPADKPVCDTWDNTCAGT